MIFKILVFDNLKIAKNECFRKIVIVTVSAKIYNWTFSIIIWHYSAISTVNFKSISLFFVDLEQFSWGPFFFWPPGIYFCKIFISNKCWTLYAKAWQSYIILVLTSKRKSSLKNLLYISTSLGCNSYFVSYKKKNSGKNLTRNGDIFAIIYH